MCVVTKEKNEELYNSLFPEDVETITMTKEDYDRNIEQLLVEKLELEYKYNLMKKNAYQLAIKIDKAIEYIEEKYITFFDNVNPLILLDKEDFNKILNILKGEDKKATVELIDDKGNKKEVNFKTIELKYGEYLKKIDGKWYVYKNKGEDKE